MRGNKTSFPAICPSYYRYCPRVLLRVSGGCYRDYHCFHAWERSFPTQETLVSIAGYASFLTGKRWFPCMETGALTQKKRLFQVESMLLQIPYLQHICNRYLQRSKYLKINIIRRFCCRWQIKFVFANFIEGKTWLIR